MEIHTLLSTAHERITFKCSCGKPVDKAILSDSCEKLLYACDKDSCLKKKTNEVSDYESLEEFRDGMMNNER